MKKFLTLVAVTISLFEAQAQKSADAVEEKLDITTSLSYLLPRTDLQRQSSKYNRTNLGTQLSIAYRFNDTYRLRGNWLMGNFDGSTSGNLYSQTFISEPSLYFDADVLELIKPGSSWQLYLGIGAGWMMIRSDVFDLKNGQRRDFVPGGKGYSDAPAIGLEGSIAAPISSRMAITLGGALRYAYSSDYLDGLIAGSRNDLLGVINLGLNITLGKGLKKGEARVNQAEFDMLKNSEKSVKEQMAKQEEENEKQLKAREAQLNKMRATNDSLKAELNKRILPPSQKEEVKPLDLSKPMWRVVVGSFPNQALAQRYMDGLNGIDKSEMQVLFVEDLKTYRVIYKSFDNMNAASKARNEIRGAVKDAWIVNF